MKSLTLAMHIGWIFQVSGHSERVWNVMDFGAIPDGKTLCSQAFQAAIDACSSSGGGRVIVPAGAYLMAPLFLRDRVEIEIQEGALLLGSQNRDDYVVAVKSASGQTEQRFCHLINGEGLRDIAIRGQGAIDGQGAAFRDKGKPRPKVISLERCRNVLVEGIHLRDAGSWMQHYRFCRDLTLRGIQVSSHATFNNDGINIDSCQDVDIRDCVVDSDDDAIVLKSLSIEPCRNVRISNCSVSSHCNGLKMGTELGGGFVDIGTPMLQPLRDLNVSA